MYKKKIQNRLSIFMVFIVVRMILIVVSNKSVQLKEKLSVYDERITSLEHQINLEEARTLEIDEYRKYTYTKKYIEDMAKIKLGLVYKDEIIFKEDN